MHHKLRVTLEKITFQVIEDIRPAHRMLKVSHDRTILKTPFSQQNSTRCISWTDALHLNVQEGGKIGIEILEEDVDKTLPEKYLMTVLEGELGVYGYDKGSHTKTVDIRNAEFKPVGKLSFKLIVTGEKKQNSTISASQSIKRVEKLDKQEDKEAPLDSLDTLMLKEKEKPKEEKPPLSGKLRMGSIIGNLKEECQQCSVFLKVRDSSKQTETALKRGCYPVWMNSIELPYENDPDLHISLRQGSKQQSKGIPPQQLSKKGRSQLIRQSSLKTMKANNEVSCLQTQSSCLLLELANLYLSIQVSLFQIGTIPLPFQSFISLTCELAL